MTTQNDLHKRMPKARGLQLLSTVLGRIVMVLWKWVVRKTKQLRPWSLYQDCRSTPMDVFIDCLVNQNIKRLVKKGGVSKTLLLSAWGKLFMEYCDLSGDSKFKSFVHLNKTIGTLRSKMLAVQLCIYVLASRDSNECAETLKKLGFAGEFKGEGKAAELLKVSKRLKSFQFELKQKVHEYQLMIKDGQSSKLESSYFDMMFVELSKFMGYRLEPSKTTVLEFVTIRNRYQKEVEVMRAKVQKS